MARRDPISHLDRHRGELPDTLLREVLGRLPAELPRLQALALDPTARTGVEPAATRARHAVHVLGFYGDLRGLETVLTLLDALEDEPSPLLDAVVRALELRAPAIVEALLARASGPHRHSVLQILVVGGARDERVVACLHAEIESASEVGILLAGIYQEPALAPALSALAERLLADPGDEHKLFVPILQALSLCGQDTQAIGERIVLRMRAEVAAKQAQVRALEEQVAAREREPGRA